MRVSVCVQMYQSGKSVTIRESNQASGVRVVLCTKKLHFVGRNWHKENKFCSICGFRPIKSILSDNPKSLISRINEVYACFNKISLNRYFIEKKPINFIIVIFY